jgi:hypothetical protein
MAIATINVFHAVHVCDSFSDQSSQNQPCACANICSFDGSTAELVDAAYECVMPVRLN